MAALSTATQVSVNVNGFPFNVWDEGTEESWTHSGQTGKAVKTWLCDWAGHAALCAALLGGSTNVSGTTIYVAGWVYPDNPIWVVQKVDVKGDGVKLPGVNGGCAYERARLTITFGVPEFTFGSPIQIGEQELDFCTNSVALDNKSTNFSWDDGSGTDLPGAQVQTIRYSTCQFQQSVYNRPVLPVTLINSLLNHVNSTPFFGAAAETVLFRGARSRRVITPNGGLNWHLDLSCEWHGSTMNGTTASWNKQWKPGVGWTAFKVKGGGKLFTPGELNALLA